MIRSYSELCKLNSFIERFRYLKLDGEIGKETFGFDRYLNQTLYKSAEWKRLRNKIIIRDNGCDLGVSGYDIFNHIIIHHINPISIEDVNYRRDDIFDPENLICCSLKTHNAIHYGDELQLSRGPIERRPGDTKLW